MARLWARRFHSRGGGPPLALLGATAALLVRPRRWAGLAAQGPPSPPGTASLAPTVPSTASATAKRAVLVRNGEAGAPWMGKDRLLKDHSGAYTTARTVNQSSIFELSMHCSRLHDTAADVLKRELAAGGGASDAAKEAAVAYLAASDGGRELKPLVRSEIVTALEYLKATTPDQAGAVDYQVTMLLTCDTVGDHTPPSRGFDIFTYVQPLPYVEPMVDLQAHKAERKNPTVKDVQWVNDRQHLEVLQRQAGVNEVIMFDTEGRVTEGLQTNFFAVRSDGTILTAPDDRVLAGTVRKVVLEVAQQKGIAVLMEAPSIHSLADWDSCFICSTSRLVKPVRALAVPDLSMDRPFPLTDSVAHRVEALVLDAVLAHSEPLAEDDV